MLLWVEGPEEWVEVECQGLIFLGIYYEMYLVIWWVGYMGILAHIFQNIKFGAVSGGIAFA